MKDNDNIGESRSIINHPSFLVNLDCDSMTTSIERLSVYTKDKTKYKHEPIELNNKGKFTVIKSRKEN